MPTQPLSNLKDWQLVDSSQDIQGRKLIDETGRDLGWIEQMIVSTENERVESVVSDRGELYPVGALEIRDDHVIFHGVKTTGLTANLEPFPVRRRTV